MGKITVGKKTRRHAELKTHSGLFCDLGLLSVDDVHDEAALAHLSQARLDDEGALHSFAIDET